MAWDVGGADRADLDVTQRPDRLRLVLGREGDDVRQFHRPAGQTNRAAAFRAPLGDLAGLQEDIADMRDEFLAAHGKAECRHRIGAADDVELWSLRIPDPTMLNNV